MSDGRRSIAKTTSFEGVGIHSGAPVKLTLRPAPAGAGIAFRRMDVPSAPLTPALVDQVSDTTRRVVLGRDGGAISGVEHLLAAITAHQLDDVLIEVHGPEMPILDGSPAPYFEEIARAGIADLGGTPRRLRLAAPLVVRDGDSSYVAAPGTGLRLTVTIEWSHPAIGRQSGCYDVTAAAFERELARARTFGFTREFEALRREGFARGADQTNTIALSEKGVAGPLRWPDEFVRHKAADLLGDLALVGGRLEADIVAFKPGHAGNVALATAIRQAAGTSAAGVMGIREILGALPHRYPMLLVDRILEVHGAERIVGLKNVTINEPFFQGHFPDHPIMPGVLIIEAMAQVGGMLLMSRIERPDAQVVYFMSIDGVKFRRPVIPGDQIRFEVEVVQVRGKTCKMRGVGRVDGQIAAEAEMMARIMDR